MVWGSMQENLNFLSFCFGRFVFVFLGLLCLMFCFVVFFKTYFHFLLDLKCTGRLIIINYCKFIISFHFEKLILLSAIGQWGGGRQYSWI